MAIIGDRIKLRRTEQELSLAELARRVDISKGYLHNIESGETVNPSAEVLFRIANELHTTIADLLGEEEQQPLQTDVVIPSVLEQFAKKAGLTEADKQMLARIEYRGKKPETLEDWQFIFESIKRTVR